MYRRPEASSLLPEPSRRPAPLLLRAPSPSGSAHSSSSSQDVRTPRGPHGQGAVDEVARRPLLPLGACHTAIVRTTAGAPPAPPRAPSPTSARPQAPAPTHGRLRSPPRSLPPSPARTQGMARSGSQAGQGQLRSPFSELPPLPTSPSSSYSQASTPPPSDAFDAMAIHSPLRGLLHNGHQAIARLAAMNLDPSPLAPASLRTEEIDQALLDLGLAHAALALQIEQAELRQVDQTSGVERLRAIDLQRAQVGNQQEALRLSGPLTPLSESGRSPSFADTASSGSPKDSPTKNPFFFRRTSRPRTSESLAPAVASVGSPPHPPSLSSQSLLPLLATLEGLMEDKVTVSEARSAQQATLRARLVLRMWLLARLRNEAPRAGHARGQSSSSQQTSSSLSSNARGPTSSCGTAISSQSSTSAPFH